MLHAAIAGLGRWGKNLVDSVHGRSERVRFVRAVDAAPDNVRAFAEERGLPLSSDFDALLEDRTVDAVVIVTPHSLHRPMVEAAARAGKHVFCEKPLALTLADARAMVDACDKAGVVLAVGHNRRLWPSMVALHGIVSSGELGQVLHIEGHFSNDNSTNAAGSWRDSPAESPGGGMTATALHLLDAFVNLVGPIRRIHGYQSVRKPPPDPRDTATLLIEFENGASGTIATVRPTPFFWRVHVFGDRGSAEVTGEHVLLVHRKNAPPERQTFEAVDSLRAELESFADAAAGRGTFHIAPAEMLANVAAFEASIAALASGQPVSVA
ncbi:MAG TPA: Gfo/Idh/MocA family oxidoreductase [Burkholderiales bacterium]|nr:Gfo/Idh/MocA family oxidoreductase [Burkholderiales bacterium]